MAVINDRFIAEKAEKPDRLYPIDLTGLTGSTIWALTMSGDRKPYAVVNSQFSELRAKFSPDTEVRLPGLRRAVNSVNFTLTFLGENQCKIRARAVSSWNWGFLGG